jgi:diapolycopene oxygenase
MEISTQLPTSGKPDTSSSSQPSHNSRPNRVAVVGGGLAGLAATCVLAARGYRVTLFEKNEWYGGKAAVHEAQGYRFDMGPTILTLPSVLKRIFSEAGRRMEDYLELLPLDPQWRCFFESTGTGVQNSGESSVRFEDQGGSFAGHPDDAVNKVFSKIDVLDLVANVDKMKQNLDRFTGNTSDSRGYEKFIEVSQQLHRVSDRFFFYRSIDGLRDTMEVGGAFSASVLKDVLSLRMGRSVASVVRSHVPDSRVAQMMDHFTQYVGSSPYQSPAVLCGIAHMQTDEGIWYPVGGTRAVPEALAKLAIELGAEIRLSTDVQRIETEGKRVCGITTSQGETISFDAVVSNCDAVRTYTELLKGTPQSKSFVRKSRHEAACSGVVLYLGLNRQYKQLLHHNFVFSRDPKEEFDWIYGKGEPAPDPTAYVCAPVISEPGVAPAGGEALYVLVHTPYLRPHHDWNRMLPEYREVILDKLERTAGLDGLRDAIVHESCLTPEGIHKRYRVLNGAIYGLASHGKFLGAFKPGNRRRDLQGLYLAGGAAHPGPGMPMVMMSGWIAADSLDADCSGF